MKKFQKLLLVIALCAIVSLPVALTGCFGGADTSIALLKSFKTAYFQTEELDVTDGMIEYLDKDGNLNDVQITEDMISGFNTTTVGNKILTISYQGEVLKIGYTVLPSRESISVDVSEMKTLYWDDEQINTQGGKIIHTLPNGDVEELQLTKGMVKNFDSSRINLLTSPGDPGEGKGGLTEERTATVEYNGFTATFNYTVKNTNPFAYILTEEDVENHGSDRYYAYGFSTPQEDKDIYFVLYKPENKSLFIYASDLAQEELYMSRLNDIKDGSYVYGGSEAIGSISVSIPGYSGASTIGMAYLDFTIVSLDEMGVQIQITQTCRIEYDSEEFEDTYGMQVAAEYEKYNKTYTLTRSISDI